MTSSSALSPNLDLAQNSLSPALSSLDMSDHVRHPLSSCSLFLRVQSCYDVTWPVTLSILSPTLSSHVGSRHQINDSVSHSLSVSLSLSPASVLSRTVSSGRSCHEMTVYPTWDLSRCVVALFHFVSTCRILSPRQLTGWNVAK